MIEIKIKEQLEKQNKNIQWLSLEAKIPYPTLHKLVNNKTESVKFGFIERICLALDCTPNDIIQVSPDPQLTLFE
ncbi:putative transcriptional regulator [Natranaerovirga pectinivora]|uniref:Putative transcriptional regulator n=1 Tax=Natranaerovirga pectinivora TaxID=682400 RepID=A0A4R3MSF0_9FIRM|nr:helix-turn-helix transcriptional regulator [Natranaerovirga pectinivora]TCT16368.1 putative transcriptional regulator [Natranaerovirga pectinivora]